MKVLSLTQPWADRIVQGLKRYETRSWKTSYRGLLIIHASKGFPPSCKALLDEEPFRSELNIAADELITGAIIGAVDLLNCWTAEGVGVDSIERSFGDFGPNRFAWETENSQQWEPIPCKGRLGLWTPTPEIQELITERINT